jgi:hypothetical protein
MLSSSPVFIKAVLIRQPFVPGVRSILVPGFGPVRQDRTESAMAV